MYAGVLSYVGKLCTFALQPQTSAYQFESGGQKTHVN